MDDTGLGQHVDQALTQSAHDSSTESPLSRRTFLGRMLGLAASLGLAGVAAACGIEGAAQQNGSQEEPAAGTGAPEDTSGTVAQQDDGQEEQAAGTAAGTLGLGIIGLHVADLGASFEFYRRLGLNIPTNVDPGGQAFRLRLPTGQIFFWETLAYTRADFPDYEQGTGDRKVSLEFGFRNAGEVDEMYDALLAEGYGSYKEPLSWGDIRYAGVVDPDGNQIALRYPLAS